MTAKKFRNPVPTVDIIIEVDRPGQVPGIVLIRRKNPPFGWALPGGFVDYGESLEEAAVREAREETLLRVDLLGQCHTYSDPRRDPRQHTVSTVFLAQARGEPKAADDAREARVFDPRRVEVELAFDHRRILDDYLVFKRGRFPWTEEETKRRKRGRSRKTP
jgi:8-oxo-dGTP diphosphatase